MAGLNDEGLGPLPADLAGRTAVVTGAAHGIGLGIARRLGQCGAQVIAVDTDEEGLRAEFAGSSSYVPFVGDLSRPDSSGLAEEVLTAVGSVELIVNNVGTTTPHDFLGLDERSFDQVMKTNLRGPWFFTRRLVESLIGTGRSGSIVFLSSLHDTVIRLNPHYSASKAAVAMLTRELAYELGRYGIRVNSVSPGSIRTVSNPAPLEEPGLGRLIPVGRTGDPDDVAKLVVVLLSDAWSGYVTGVNLRVDGGLGLHTWLTDK